MKLVLMVGVALLATAIGVTSAEPAEIAEAYTVPYNVFSSADGKTIDVYLGDEIEHSLVYSHLEMMLSKATPSHTFIFHIAGYGGSTDAGTQLMRYIQDTKAKTVMVIEAPSYSMHAVIACVGKEIRANPHTYLMFHDYSLQFSGKANEISKMLKASDEQLAGLMQDTCIKRGLLTKEEVRSIMESGTDVYLSDKEINKRVSH